MLPWPRIRMRGQLPSKTGAGSPPRITTLLESPTKTPTNSVVVLADRGDFRWTSPYLFPVAVAERKLAKEAVVCSSHVSFRTHRLHLQSAKVTLRIGAWEKSVSSGAGTALSSPRARKPFVRPAWSPASRTVSSGRDMTPDDFRISFASARRGLVKPPCRGGQARSTHCYVPPSCPRVVLSPWLVDIRTRRPSEWHRGLAEGSTRTAQLHEQAPGSLLPVMETPGILVSPTKVVPAWPAWAHGMRVTRIRDSHERCRQKGTRLNLSLCSRCGPRTRVEVEPCG